jgi:hypothetical protein
MIKNLNIKRSSVAADRIENVKPQIAAEKVVGSGDYSYIPPNTDTGLNIPQQPQIVGGMNPILKYAIIGIGGALVVYFAYRKFIK